jgi:membrane-bound ClpP family serine protease
MMTQTSANSTHYGVVDKAIAPHQPGRIRFQGTYWKAALADPNCKRIEVGQTVQVVGMQGITLLVVPERYEFSTQVQEQAEDWRESGRSVLVGWTQQFNSMFATALG